MYLISDSTLQPDMDYQFRFRYETLRSLLNKNGSSLQLMSDLEADLNHISRYDDRIKRPIVRLISEALLMAQELNLLTKDRHAELYQVIFRLKNDIDELFKSDDVKREKPSVLMTTDIESPDSTLVGGKAGGLILLRKHFKNDIPPAFVVTTQAYNKILDQDDLHHRIHVMLRNIDVTEDSDQFSLRTGTIRKWIKDAPVPKEIEDDIFRFAALISETFKNSTWAVRSSAVSEDGKFSFAGQFKTRLKVEKEQLIEAYKDVLASRFEDHAVKYRVHNGLREVDTPMAVLFMPMIDAKAAGVIYTSDIQQPGQKKIVINSVPGLADEMVRGEAQADTFFFSREATPRLVEAIPYRTDMAKEDAVSYIPEDKLGHLSTLSIKAKEISGQDVDMEWALDKQGKIWLLQSRPLNTSTDDSGGARVLPRNKDQIPVVEGGITIFPGRAEGPIYFVEKGFNLSEVPEGAVVFVEKPKPEFSSLLPKISALLVMEGNPAGHLATLAREYSVPCIFRLGKHARLLAGKNILSVNATKRKIYAGSRWPGMWERGLTRIALRASSKKSGPLSDLVLRLNLLNPDDASFKPQSCQSVHDVFRFVHEMAVRSMFGFGDAQKKGFVHKGKPLKSTLPVKIYLISLDNTIDESAKNVAPERVDSTPFHAFWRGMADERMAWPERWDKEMAGLPPSFRDAVLGGNKGPRKASDRNYAIIARDYLNINARFAYHYAMVDSMVAEGAENNHVHFRLRGGGASDENRVRRARFLEQVLRASGFGVEQQGDLVTAWMRRYSREESEKALEIIGRLMVCARQLDAVLKRDSDVKLYASYFLKEKYEIFS